MKRKLLLFALILSVLPMSAQESTSTNTPKKRIGISVSPYAYNDIFTFESLIGAGSHTNDGSFSIAVNYLQELKPWLELETGLEYSRHNTIIKSSPTPEVKTWKAHLNLVEIPVTVKARFLRYFFVNGGAIVHFDITNSSSIDNQTGLGALLGIGAEYAFSPKISAFVNPYVKMNTLLPFSPDTYHERTGVSGVRIGLIYTLP